MASKKQQTLSSFFQKPVSATSKTLRADSGDDEFELPDPKRRKVSTETSIPTSREEPSAAVDSEESHLRPLSANGQNARSLPVRTPVPQRTSKYLFNSSPQQENGTITEAHDPRKAELHRRFVKKLGNPDSINDIKRRNRALFEDEAADDEGDDDEDAAPEAVKPAAKGKGGKKGTKLTPMEKQVIDIKQAYKDTLLVVEVGYKFKFWGEDARIAAKELGIVCIPGKYRFDEHPSEAHIDRFASASIPVHRLHVHVKRLVQAGHKVGVVRQIETAALKAVGDNRNTPFVRKLTNLYTKGTYIDDVEGLEEANANQAVNPAKSTGFLLCLTETNAKGYGNDEKVHVGLVAVQPATGDIVYDDFEDGFMRSEIETRLLHIAPCEFLILGDLSKATDKLVMHLSGSKANVFGDKARVERVNKHKTTAAEAHNHVSTFYAEKLRSSSQEEKAAKILDKVLGLPEHVMVCLSALMTHMTDYGLANVFDLTKYFQPFSARSHMLLNGNTLNSLEIYQNQTDYTVKGSLFWTLDRTQTKFGSRLLRKWVGRPLLDKTAIDARLGAVEELLDPEKSAPVEKLKRVLTRLRSDLEKSLLRIYYGKCSRPELLTVLQAFQHLAQEYSHATSREATGFSSDLLANAVTGLPTIQSDIITYLDKINLHAAKSDDKYAFFREEHETEDISDHKYGISSVEHDLDVFRAVAAEKLGRKRPVDYATVAGIDYLIEIENSSATIKKVPASWTKISHTKKLSRFHPPEVIKLIRERDQHKESLAAACDAAFQTLLANISAQYAHFRDAILSLATLDCLMSLATIAQQPGYTRPTFVDRTQVEVKGARHPMIEQLLLDAYVPNDISLHQDTTRALLVTGPNMGGKSSYVRSVALITIMAQIGSFVPADEAKLGIVDAVFTRMGAFDNMMAGESTFMVELSETSDILKLATDRSLVVLDELGRGTSTHDGVAIAGAVLDWLVREKKCLTLFITHYQVLAWMANSFEEGELKNVHMRFSEDTEGGDNVTFLYEVGEGIAYRSYGLNVARLAGLEGNVIDLARDKSSELEREMKQKRLRGVAKGLTGAEGSGQVDFEALAEAIEMM
ncbi:Mismatch repair protein msh3 [Exophiala xenobiotica]|uniref:DNA mismatch repair protein MSH3 n=1 Tax=Lithohypha guttulata TaxID=1690604 RepID=A0ABR0KMH2_9EURO|nr:Mismatch repair protein msh3 [Lithohypha guttulata]KAK5328011.1 Mismatch repair protein msh3 [Exophiala xenobiotica]